MSRRKEFGFDFLMLVPWYLNTTSAVAAVKPAKRDQLAADDEPTVWRRGRLVDPTERPLCPECGGDMQQRTFAATHEEFWGCASFPKCEGAREIAD